MINNKNQASLKQIKDYNANFILVNFFYMQTEEIISGKLDQILIDKDNTWFDAMDYTTLN